MVKKVERTVNEHKNEERIYLSLMSQCSCCGMVAYGRERNGVTLFLEGIIVLVFVEFEKY